MKNITKLFFAAAFLTAGMASAQTGGVGVGTTTPDASSALDVTSTTKGFLMPRMTTVQRTTITTPATGLQVYDTDTKSQWFYNGTVWVQGASKADGSKWTNDATNTRVALTNLSDGATARQAGTEYNIYDDGTVNIGSGIGNRLNSKLQVFRNITSLPVSVGYVNTSSILKMSGGLASGRSVASNFNLLNLGSAESNNYDGTIQANRSQILLGTDLGMNADASGSVNNAFNGIVNEAQGLNTGVFNNTIGTGKIVTAKGIEVSVDRTGTGIIKDAYGIFVRIVRSIGTDADAHNSYGVYIANAILSAGGSTNKAYSVYSASTAPSYYAGNIGIGINNTVEKFEVDGAIKIGSTSAATPTAGTIRFNTTTSKFEGYDGTAWVAFH